MILMGVSVALSKEKVPVCTPCFNPVRREKSVLVLVVLKITSILRPSLATSVMPLLLLKESIACTPVCAEMKLIAWTAAIRDSCGLFSTVLIIGVVKPLIFKLPLATPLPPMAAPVMTQGLTVACTPVAKVCSLMAAALAMALAIWLPLCGETVSASSEAAPMEMPLMITSLAYIGSKPDKPRDTFKPTTSPEANAAVEPSLAN